MWCCARAPAEADQPATRVTVPAAKSPHHVAAVHGAHAGAGRGVGAGSTAVAAYGINGSGATGSSRTHVSALDLSELQAPLSPEALDHSSRALSQAHVLDSCAVMVCVRVRPMNAKEKRQNCDVCLDVEGEKVVRVLATTATPNSVPAAEGGLGGTGRARAARSFTFDAVLGPDTQQPRVFHETAETVLHKVLRGFNGTVFAYGQTGSGKTYTMEGAPDAPGVVPQLCVQLFAHRQAEMHRTAFTIKASYIEIYQETLRDLLGSSTFERRPSGAGATATPLTVTDAGDEQGSGSRPVIREHPVTGVFLDNVVEHTVMSYEDIAAIIAMGTSRRTKGHTKMNAVSSRSHAVLSLFIEQQDVQDNDGLTRLTSQLNLCDLAGSERAKATGATGVRLKEASKINQSLSALGNVINALTSKNRSHVPYRDSKLTRLLQNSLGGNAVTLMICCISPASRSRDETVSSLRFAERAKQIKNMVKVNVDPAALRIAQLMAENTALRLRLRVANMLLLEHGIDLSSTEVYEAAKERMLAEEAAADGSGSGKAARKGSNASSSTAGRGRGGHKRGSGTSTMGQSKRGSLVRGKATRNRNGGSANPRGRRGTAEGQNGPKGRAAAGSASTRGAATPQGGDGKKGEGARCCAIM